MRKLVLFVLLFFHMGAFAQEQLTLEDCYQLVDTNYPLSKQNALLEKQNALDLEVIGTETLPQIDFLAQATYQSDVIEIPIPNAGIEPLNKDQYRATVSVNQLLYGGGMINASLSAKSATLKTRLKQVEVNLYQLKKQINTLYFSVLLQQEKNVLLIAKREQLQAKFKEVKSGIKNGFLLPTSDKILEAELLKIDQLFIELNQNKITLVKTLSSLIGTPIATTIHFQDPTLSSELNSVVNRPELELFQFKKEEVETAEQLLLKQNSPKLMGFANGGYGNPGLNMLDNSFQAFYTIGVKLNWSVFDWNANKKKRESLSINKDMIDTETELFQLNTNIELNQQQSEIEKLEQFIVSDIEIIQLRKEVLKSTASQLQNGIITSSTYIIELTNLYEAENSLSTHKIQLLLARANYNTTKGQ